MTHLGGIPAGATIHHLFGTYGSSGESITVTNFAAADVEIYKNGSATQRTSDNGITVDDDFDFTGIHKVSIDLSDDSDAGFYSVGGWYNVVVGPITVNTQTVYFPAFSFRIVAAEAQAGYPKVDTQYTEGGAVADETDVGAAAADAIGARVPGDTATYDEIMLDQHALARGAGTRTPAPDDHEVELMDEDGVTPRLTATWASGSRTVT